MAKYIARKTAPSTADKNYIHYSKGGYNYCLKIKNGSCLPNCVGYAWGRWRELLGKRPSLSRSNAENWYGYTADGYKRGNTPKLGAVICWRKGQAGNSSDGAGHVAIVEEIKADGTIVTSNSAYNGTRWYLREFKPPYVLSSKYTFQGFIYPPVNYDEETVSTTTTTKYKTGNYCVIATLLNVRKGAGKNYSKLKYKDFTANAQKQIYSLAKYKANGYVKGVKFSVSKIKDNWGKTPSGWVCLDYCEKI